MIRSCLISVLTVLLVTACSTVKSYLPSRPAETKTDLPANAPALIDVGKITQVNSNARFVIMTFPLGAVPGIDRRLNIYRNGKNVGEIKVTGPQRDVNTVGDIIAGEAQINDEVRAN